MIGQMQMAGCGMILGLLILAGPSLTMADKVTFCYYSSFAQTRPEPGRFLPEDIDPYLCTHVIFAFVDVIDGRRLEPSNRNDVLLGGDGLYDRTNALKRINPKLKVLLAVGGWAIGSDPFVPITSDPPNQRYFVSNLINYLRKYDFDGLDMDWEFPGSRGSPPEDKYRFTTLMEDIQSAFETEARDTGQEKLLLTLAAAAGSHFIDTAYEPRKIVKIVDFLLVMTYNYHGSWDDVTGHHSGIVPHTSDKGKERQLNQMWTLEFYLSVGAPRHKIVVGIATYGMSFTLANRRQHGVKAPVTGGGRPGPYTRESGILSYFEICEFLDSGWKSVWMDDMKAPYAYGGDQWVGYDDVNSVTYKAKNILDMDLGGAFIWSVEMDDFSGHCGGEKYPLLSTINKIIRPRAVRSRSNGISTPYSEVRKPNRGPINVDEVMEEAVLSQSNKRMDTLTESGRRPGQNDQERIPLEHTGYRRMRDNFDYDFELDQGRSRSRHSIATLRDQKRENVLNEKEIELLEYDLDPFEDFRDIDEPPPMTPGASNTPSIVDIIKEVAQLERQKLPERKRELGLLPHYPEFYPQPPGFSEIEHIPTYYVPLEQSRRDHGKTSKIPESQEVSGYYEGPYGAGNMEYDYELLEVFPNFSPQGDPTHRGGRQSEFDRDVHGEFRPEIRTKPRRRRPEERVSPSYFHHREPDVSLDWPPEPLEELRGYHHEPHSLDNTFMDDNWMISREDDAHRRSRRLRLKKKKLISRPRSSARTKEYKSKKFDSAPVRERILSEKADQSREPPTCSQPGPIADPVQCKTYYICVRTGKKWSMLYMSCREGFEFHPTQRACLKGYTCAK